MLKNKRFSWILGILSVLFLAALINGIRSVNPGHIPFKPSIFLLIPLFSSVTNAVLLGIVVKRRSSIKSVLWFCVFIICALIWSLADLATFTTTSSYVGMISRTAIPLAALIGLPALLIFVANLTVEKAEDMIGTWVTILFTSYAFLFFILSTNLIFLHETAKMILRYWGYEITLGPLGTIYLIWSQLLILFIASLLIRYYLHQKPGIKKRQARIFLISIMVSLVGSTFTNIIPALVNVSVLPLDSLFITIMTGLMCYGIIRYRLFVINPAEIATNILDTMAETVIVTNPKFELQYTNDNAERVFGVDANNMNGSRIDSYFSPHHFSMIRKHLMVDPMLKQPKKFEDLAVVAQHTHKITPVDLAISSVLDKDGNLAGYVFVMADISALKHAYAQLANEEKEVERKVVERTQQLFLEHTKLETSIANLPIGLIMLDEKQDVLEVNESAKSLLSIKDKTKASVLAGIKKLGVEDQFHQVQESCVMVDLEEITLGQKILHVIVTPIIGKGTECLGSVVLVEDITKQKIAERERNEFIVTASHEMRTPLTIIQGNLSNALDPDIAKLDSKTRPILEQAYDSTTHLSELFKDILTVAEIDNSDTPHYENKTEFNLSETVEEVVKKLRTKADKDKIALSLGGQTKVTTVLADQNEIKEVLLKLVDNAIKYTPKGFVNVDIKPSSDHVVVTVEDSGRGISADDRGKLFKKFARLDNDLTREVGGTGLGLYIAQSLAKRNDGVVTLEHSTKKGSIFSLELPLKKK